MYESTFIAIGSVVLVLLVGCVHNDTGQLRSLAQLQSVDADSSAAFKKLSDNLRPRDGELGLVPKMTANGKPILFVKRLGIEVYRKEVYVDVAANKLFDVRGYKLRKLRDATDTSDAIFNVPLLGIDVAQKVLHFNVANDRFVDVSVHEPGTVMVLKDGPSITGATDMHTDI